MRLGPGDVFAGYTIMEALGAGGMGEVYLARHPRLPRRDALKILPAGISGDASFRDRFTREADLASSLWHANVVSVYDRGDHNGQLWIAMEFVDGTDAGQQLAGTFPGGMPVDEVARIVTAMAAALDHAHGRGLLHRDVKPANIMLAAYDAAGDEERRILLADFGIARPLDEANGLTTTNMTVGTVAYAAPEQLMGETVDGRADQYALAATAYHLLSGEQLFPQSNPAVVISRHLNADPPSLSRRHPKLAALDPVLARALSKDPAGRYSRCTDFAKALNAAAAADAHSTSAPTVSAPKAASKSTLRPPPTSPTVRNPRRWVAAGALALVVGLVTVTLVLLRPWQSPTASDSVGASGADLPRTSTVSASLTSPTSVVPPVTVPPEPSTAATTSSISAAGFYGEWGQHATSVTLAPDGTARYAVWSGVANGTSWSATWSAMSSTTAMIVLTEELESHGDTSNLWLNRYGGEAFTFTLRSDGYATITNPSGDPVVLCPRGTGFRDSQGLCGA